MDAYTPPNNLDPVAFLAGSFGGNVAPYSNVTPFTHRDARTFEGRVEALVYWVNNEFVLWNNTEINRLVDEVNKQYQQFRQVFVDFTELTQADQAAFQGVVQAAEALITAASKHVDEGVAAAAASADEAERWNAATEGLQDAAVASLLTRPETTAHKAAMSALFTESAFGTVVPVDVTFESIQVAATEAGARGLRLQASGTITTAQTLVLRCDGDLGNLTINYTGTGVAVQVGSFTEVTNRKTLVLPRVVNTNKTNAGWDQVVGSTGVQLVNLNAWPSITIPHVQHFDVGVHLTGRGRGIVHNTVLVGQLDNNKRNMYLDADATGWCNQNYFLNGRYSHNSIEGLNVPGVRHVHIQKGLVSAVNGNVWVNPSLEYGTPEFHFDFAGIHNDVYNGRWEVVGGARVRWQDASNRNNIFGGYAAHLIKETFETAVVGCNIESGTRKRFAMSNAGPVTVFENQSSSALPTRVVLPAGTTVAGTDPATAWTVRETSLATSYRKVGDEFDRVRVDHVNGRVYLGAGTTEPTAYLGTVAGSVAVNGSLGLLPNNASDIGVAGAMPRFVKAATALVPPAFITAARPDPTTLDMGSMVWDRNLNKPVYVNTTRTGWVDATGATV